MTLKSSALLCLLLVSANTRGLSQSATGPSPAALTGPIAASTPAASALLPVSRSGLRLSEIQLHDPYILAEATTQTYYLYTSAATRRTGQNRTGTFAYK